MSSREQLLKEYAKLATAVANVNSTVQEMNAVDINQVIAKIRLVERKMGVVYTIFRSSVYSVTKQTQDQDQDHGYEQGEEQEQGQLVGQDREHEQERARNSMQYSREQDSLAQSQQLEDYYYHHGQQQQQHNQEQYYHDQHDQELQRPQHEQVAQTHELPAQRTSIYASNDGSNMPRSSRFSNATRLSGPVAAQDGLKADSTPICSQTDLDFLSFLSAFGIADYTPRFIINLVVQPCSSTRTILARQLMHNPMVTISSAVQD
ncbi:hypothetical protein BG011_009087 [Mortierella polycephala]|uniref:Uncharacterized protein n=1 Tax=Mortierella polycephala TaxID=41804 RepID=A0A9P6Q8Y8_9FUNG|nr:hypothetical protein BG011_009087 [Mortierella polycephala]